MQELKTKLEKTVGHLEGELSSIQTGRASTGLVDNMEVDMYGTKTPLRQVASVAVTDTRSLSIQPWDKAALVIIEKAIRESDLGVSPVNDGNAIRVNLPELTEERRKDYVKVVKERAEDARVSVRSQRRETIEEYKNKKKSGEMSENDYFAKEKEIQKVVGEYNDRIDKIVTNKEKEIMSV